MDEQKRQKLDGALIVDDNDDVAESEQEIEFDPEDGKAEQSVEVLTELLELMDLEAEVVIRDNAAKIILDVAGEDAGRVIGKKGQTLDALQFLLNKIINRFPKERRHIILDSGDYRERKDAGLEHLAKRQAKRAMQKGVVINLEPMSPRDRRIIHGSLAKFPGVNTRSNGQGANRRVQIIPTKLKRRASNNNHGNNRNSDNSSSDGDQN